MEPGPPQLIDPQQAPCLQDNAKAEIHPAMHDGEIHASVLLNNSRVTGAVVESQRTVPCYVQL